MQDPREPSGPSLPPANRLLPLGIGLGLGMMVLITVTAIRRRPAPAPIPSANPASESSEQRFGRLARACEATRAVFWNGGPWGAMPLEGFVVHLRLGPHDGKKVAHPLLESAPTQKKIGPDVDATLAKVSDGRVAQLENLPETETGLVFFEGYARAFFELEGRDRFIALGERLARETNADWAVLYAGCGHLDTRDVGAWFHGRDAKMAASALVYVMGLPGGAKTPKHVPAAKDLGAITALSARLDDPEILQLVRDDGARTVETDGVSITFPYSNPVRAAQSSTKIAERLGLR